MDLYGTAAVSTLLTLPVAAVGVGLAIHLGLVRARRAERRLAAAEELLKAKVLPYLERRARKLGGGARGRGPAVVLGPDGSIVVTSELTIAHEVGRLVGQIEAQEEGEPGLSTSDTQQVGDGPPSGPLRAKA